MAKKKSILVAYSQGLGSFLDDHHIEWSAINQDTIKIFIDKMSIADVFKLGFSFGRFYETN